MSTASPSFDVRGLLTNRGWLLEVFIVSNVAFLIIDVYVAHSFNDFAHWGEYVPLAYAVVGTVALAWSVWVEARHPDGERPSWIGTLVGWVGVAVGVAGLVWHLEAWFFEAVSLRSLVYSAPFAAPLAFAGLGLLLLMNRRVPAEEAVWGQWVLFLAGGGFVGNFALSVVDHAQNGFFFATEWIPVVSSALAVGIIVAVLLVRPTQTALKVGAWVMGLQGAVGLLGFALHVAPVFVGGEGTTLWEQIVYGAPVFAPLLFVDLAVLGGLGVWDLWAKLYGEDASVAAGAVSGAAAS